MGTLSKEEILERLATLSGWLLQGSTIEKLYEFPAFMEGIRFVNQVAAVAERADHHPDIHINYRKVTLQLTTHSAGGLTDKDFRLATEIDQTR